MKEYIIRRILFSLPVILGVMLITFALFFFLTTPRNIARQILGDKAKNEVIENWIKIRGLDQPYFLNLSAKGLKKITSTIFYTHMTSLLFFDFGRSWQDDRPVSEIILERAFPSLSFTVPVFFLSLLISISLAMFLAFFRGTYIDSMGTFLCVLGMSVVIIIYIITFQWIFSMVMRLAPVSGWAGWPDRLRFIFIPVLIGITAGLGGSIRYYRTIMLEETGKEYVRTARAKGLHEIDILFRHALKNAMIPVLTNTVMAIPFLFMGALLTETFFGIPGLGSFAIDAFFSNDLPSIKAVIFIGAVLYQAGLILTDISYAAVDPRIVFE